MGKIGNMSDVMREYEDELMAKAKAEMAAEKAAWDALPQSERDRITAGREAYWEDYWARHEEAVAKAEAEAEDEDEEDEDDSDEELP